MFSRRNENRAGSGTKPPPLPTIQAEEAVLHEKMVPVLEPVFLHLSAGGLRRGDISAGEGADSGGAPAEETQTGGETAEPGRVTETFRLVTAGDSDDPASVLAAVGGTSGDVYTLDIFSVEDVTLEGYTPEETAAMDWSPMPGALVEVTWDGSVMESYPARFGDVTSVRILESGFNDLCRLYLDVLQDLWNVDAGLNEGITELGVDLSETSCRRASARRWPTPLVCATA